MDQIPEKFDVIIVGGGPAGMSAAVWCSDLGMTSVVLEKARELGGQLNKIHAPITNYLGVCAENGRAIRDVFAGQISGIEDRVRTGTNVIAIDPYNLTVTLDDGKTIIGGAIVIATGVRRRQLSIPGEREFAGRGVLESGAAARGQLSGKRVVIAGGGDAAFENAIILGEDAKLVTLLHRSSNFSARTEFVSQVRDHPKVNIIPDVTMSKIIGKEAVEAVEYTDRVTGETTEVAADAVLIRIGVVPNTDLLPNEIVLDGHGYIVVDRSCMTNIPLVFAVGDVSNPIGPTINGAAGDAATAVKAAYRLLAESKTI